MNNSNTTDMTIYVDQKHINNLLIEYLNELSRNLYLASDDIPLLCFDFQTDANNQNIKVAKVSFGFTHDVNEVCFTSRTFTSCLTNAYSIVESKILFKTYMDSLTQTFHSTGGFIDSLKKLGITTYAFNNEFSDKHFTTELIF